MSLRMAQPRLAALAAPAACRSASGARCACVQPAAALLLRRAPTPAALPASACRGTRRALRAARRGAAGAPGGGRTQHVATAAAATDVIDAEATVIDTRIPVTVLTGYLGCASAGVRGCVPSCSVVRRRPREVQRAGGAVTNPRTRRVSVVPALGAATAALPRGAHTQRTHGIGR
jgi:hypothetical protein